MDQVSIFDLASYSFFEIFMHIKENCESGRPAELEEIKYADLISLAASCKPFAALLRDWNTKLYNSLEKYIIFRYSDINIDFEEVHTRLKNELAKYKETYWSSLSQAIRDAPATDVELCYAPESHHSDYMDAFHTVIDQLKKKTNLKELHIDVSGYTLEGLGALRSLEELRLNVRMDIDDLVEICRLNKNLRVLKYMNNETGGKRLAAIVPHCEQLEHLAFAMRPDCDASEYRPLAKIPRLQYLQIKGVHEKGTLQPLLEGLACTQSKVLDRLYIDEATLDHNETQAMAQINTLTRVECGFDDPQSIGLVSQLTELNHLKILSKHDSRTLCEQVLRIIVESKGKTRIELDNSSISYETCGNLTLDLRDQNANTSDYSPLSTLPGFTSLTVQGSSQAGSLLPILNGLRNAPTMPNLGLGNITAEETAAVSEIVSLKRLTCGFVETQNAELLAELPELEELTITSAPSYPGSLWGLLSALASKEPQTLQKFHILNMRIDPREAMELARLCGRSLRTLECQFYDPLDIQLLSELTELEELHLTVAEVLGNISPMVLEVIKSCPRLATIHISNVFMNRPSRVDIKSSFMLVGMLEACRDKIDIQINGGCISFDRETNKLLVAINLYYRNNLLMEALACLRPLNHLEITGCLAAGSLRDLFAALAARTTHYLQSLSIDKGSLDFGDTMELAKITTWTSFTGQLSDVRSFWHLIHLSDFKVFEKRIGGRKITFDQSTGKLTVSPLNVSLGDRLANGIGLNPLAGLQNLRKVFIAGVFEYGSMRDFLGQLAACQGETLQELRVDRRYEMSKKELREVSRMKSLRTLVCSVSHVQDIEIEQLAHLPHLAVLVVGSHRAGSLKNLLGSLAASKCPTLVHLAVRGESLTPQEVTEVSAIGSLKGLECAFCSTEGLDVLSQRNCIEHLGITTREGEASLVDLLTAFASSGESNIQKLIIDGPPFGQELATAINFVLRIPRLKSLKLPIKDTQGIERLAQK